MFWTERSEIPIVVAFVEDLLMATRIEGAVSNLGGRLFIVDDQDFFESPRAGSYQRQAAEPVFGPEARLMEWITSHQPNLIVFDISVNHIPWQTWISILKSSPSTRGIPIICFGPHIAVEMMSRAQSVGADGVFPRSRFVSKMVDLLSDYVRKWDYPAIDKACLRPISELAYEGLIAFNEGDYYLAHELLEDAWNEDASKARDLYKGILQVGIAYFQIERGNFKGAVKMFLRARQWLNPLPDICRGINIRQLRIDAANAHEALLSIGSDHIAQFNRQLFTQIQFEYPLDD